MEWEPSFCLTYPPPTGWIILLLDGTSFGSCGTRLQWCCSWYHGLCCSCQSSILYCTSLYSISNLCRLRMVEGSLSRWIMETLCGKVYLGWGSHSLSCFHSWWSWPCTPHLDFCPILTMHSSSFCFGCLGMDFLIGREEVNEGGRCIGGEISFFDAWLAEWKIKVLDIHLA